MKQRSCDARHVYKQIDYKIFFLFTCSSIYYIYDVSICYIYDVPIYSIYTWVITMCQNCLW